MRPEYLFAAHCSMDSTLSSLLACSIVRFLTGPRLPLPRYQPFQASCLHPENYGEGEEMGRAMSIDVAISFIVLPSCASVTALWTMSWLLLLAS